MKKYLFFAAIALFVALPALAVIGSLAWLVIVGRDG